jgi:hypothetical protein
LCLSCHAEHSAGKNKQVLHANYITAFTNVVRDLLLHLPAITTYMTIKPLNDYLANT